MIKRLLQKRAEIQWIIIGQVATFFGGWIGIKALTLYLGPAAYGEFSLSLTIASTVNAFIYGPIGNGVTRFYAEFYHGNRLQKYFGLILPLLNKCNIFVFATTILATGITWSIFGKEWGAVIFFSGCYAIVSGLTGVAMGFFSARRERKTVALTSGAETWLRSGIAFGIILLLGKNAASGVLGYALGSSLILVFCYYRIIHTRNSSGDGAESPALELKQEFWNYIRPYVIWASFQTISLFADRWLLQYLFGNHDVGIYSAMLQIANTPMILAASVLTFLVVPIAFDRAGDLATPNKISAGVRIIVLSVAALTPSVLIFSLICWAFDAKIIQFLSSKDFVSESGSLWILALATGFLQIGLLASQVGAVVKRTAPYTYAFGIKAILMLVLCYSLGKFAGLPGVAWGNLLSNFIYMIVTFIIGRALLR